MLYHCSLASYSFVMSRLYIRNAGNIAEVTAMRSSNISAHTVGYIVTGINLSHTLDDNNETNVTTTWTMRYWRIIEPLKAYRCLFDLCL